MGMGALHQHIYLMGVSGWIPHDIELHEDPSRDKVLSESKHDPIPIAAVPVELEAREPRKEVAKAGKGTITFCQQERHVDRPNRQIGVSLHLWVSEFMGRCVM